MVCSRLVFGLCVLCLAFACQRGSQDGQATAKKGFYVDPVSGALSLPVDPGMVESLAEEYGDLFDDTAERLEQLMGLVGSQSGACDRAARRLEAFIEAHGLKDALRFESFAERLWMRSRKEANLVIQRSRDEIERRMARFRSRLSQHKRVLDAFAQRCPDAAIQVQAALERFLEQTVGSN